MCCHLVPVRKDLGQKQMRNTLWDSMPNFQTPNRMTVMPNGMPSLRR